jgi:hypothetical protein
MLSPVPLSATVCVPQPDVDTVSVPFLAPAAVGVKVMPIVQVAPDKTEEPQLSVSAKSPVAEIPVKFSVDLPFQLSVTLCAALVVW